MKKCVWIIISMVVSSCWIKANAQSHEAQQLLLNVEKLAQLKNILRDLKKGYQIVSAGYGTIKNISEGNFKLHQTFLDNLLQISPVVRNYKRVEDIISGQVQLVTEYKTAYQAFRKSGSFSPGELGYLSKVYSNLFNASLKSLDALATVVTAGKLRMSDDERLNAIDGIWKDVEDQLSFLRHFNNSAKVLALQRAKEQNDIDVSRKLYNINP